MSDNIRVKTSALNYLTPVSIDNSTEINPAIAPCTTVYDKQLGVNITTVNNSVGASTCYSQLSSGKPLHISITRTGGSHSVLIAGVYYLDISNTGGIYTLMDPNVSSLVSLAVQPSVIQNGSGFNYVTGYGYTYTNWEITRY